jgi:hypothetical protein
MAERNGITIAVDWHRHVTDPTYDAEKHREFMEACRQEGRRIGESIHRTQVTELLRLPKADRGRSQMRLWLRRVVSVGVLLGLMILVRWLIQ